MRYEPSFAHDAGKCWFPTYREFTPSLLGVNKIIGKPQEKKQAVWANIPANDPNGRRNGLARVCGEFRSRAPTSTGGFALDLRFLGGQRTRAPKLTGAPTTA
jgi:hypothetical protein